MRTRIAIALGMSLLVTEPASGASFSDHRELIRAPDGARVSVDGDRLYIGDQIAYTSREGGTNKVLGYGFGRRWPHADFVYAFTGQWEDQKTIFREACARWTQNTPLRCVERTTQQSYMKVVSHLGEGCGGNAAWISCSPVGFREGVQSMEIYAAHFSPSSMDVLLHEIGHAIGFHHEHERRDRDQFVNVNWGNITAGAADQFAKVGGISMSVYDYRSIMHYDNCAFSKYGADCFVGTEHRPTRWTLSPSDCNIDAPLSGPTISQLDYESVRRAYLGMSYSELFGPAAQLSCQLNQYTEPQRPYLLGSGLRNARFQQQWKREATFLRTSQGGFLSELDPNAFCASRGQMLVRRWTDKDQHVGYANYEEWTKCGCSILLVNLTCTQTNRQIDLPYFRTEADERQLVDRKQIEIIELLRSIQTSSGGLSDGQIADLVLSTMLFANAPEDGADPRSEPSRRKLEVPLTDTASALKRLVTAEPRLEASNAYGQVERVFKTSGFHVRRFTAPGAADTSAAYVNQFLRAASLRNWGGKQCVRTKEWQPPARETSRKVMADL